MVQSKIGIHIWRHYYWLTLYPFTLMPPHLHAPLHMHRHAMSVCRSLIGLDSGTLIDLIATPDLCLHFSLTTLRFVCPSL
jgi:hypothetical protein